MELAHDSQTDSAYNDLEWSLVAAVLQDPHRLSEASSVEPRMLRDPVAADAWRAILDLYDEGEPIDVVLLVGRLVERKAVRNPQAFAERLDATLGVPANAAHYARAIRERHQDRVIRAATRAVAHAPPDMVADALATLAKLVQERRDGQQRYTMPEALQAWHDEQEAERNGSALMIGTGLPRLDAGLRKLRAGRLYVVAARPGMGKTAFALNVAAAAAREGFGVAFISLEMLPEDLAARMIGIESGASQDVIAGHEAPLFGDDEAIATAKRTIAGWPITIRLCPDPKTNRVLQAARDEMTRGAKLLIVDYLQKMQGADPKMPRHEQIGDAIQSLKNFALSYRVPVVVLCQLNRDLEKRDDKRPRLSDLRDSGWIEQEADAVLSLYREEVYDDSAQVEKGVVEIGVLKQRFGKLGMTRARFDTWSQRFAPMAGQEGGRP